MVILSHKKSGIVLKLWHDSANSVDVMRLILSSGLLDPIGTSRVLINVFSGKDNSESPNLVDLIQSKPLQKNLYRGHNDIGLNVFFIERL